MMNKDDVNKQIKKQRSRYKDSTRKFLENLETYFFNRKERKSPEWFIELCNKSAENDGWIKLLDMTQNDLNFPKLHEKAGVFLKNLADEESKIIQISQDGCKVRKRADAVSFEQCGIFIENIPLNSSQEILRQAFSSFGRILALETPAPKVKNSCDKNRGFCFIYFSKSQEANRALEYFKQQSNIVITPIEKDTVKNDADKNQRDLEKLNQDTLQQSENKLDESKKPKLKRKRTKSSNSVKNLKKAALIDPNLHIEAKSDQSIIFEASELPKTLLAEKRKRMATDLDQHDPNIKDHIKKVCLEKTVDPKVDLPASSSTYTKEPSTSKSGTIIEPDLKKLKMFVPKNDCKPSEKTVVPELNHIRKEKRKIGEAKLEYQKSEISSLKKPMKHKLDGKSSDLESRALKKPRHEKVEPEKQEISPQKSKRRRKKNLNRTQRYLKTKSERQHLFENIKAYSYLDWLDMKKEYKTIQKANLQQLKQKLIENGENLTNLVNKGTKTKKSNERAIQKVDAIQEKYIKSMLTS